MSAENLTPAVRPRVCLIHRGRLAQPAGYSTRVSSAIAGISKVADLDIVRVYFGETAPQYIVGDPEIRRSIHVQAVAAWRAPWRAIVALVNPNTTFRLGRFNAGGERAAIAAALNERYDIAWCVGEAAVLLAPAVRPTRTIFDLNDYEVDLNRAIAKAKPGRNRVRSLLTSIDLWRQRRALGRLVSQVDVAVVSSPVDAAASPGHVITLPNAYPDPGPLGPPAPNEGPPIILMPGLYTHFPNEDGAVWLVNEIWPSVRAALPDARLRIAGKSTPTVEALADRPGVEVTGFVPSMLDEVRRATVVVAPLRYGSGTRVKILEAWSIGTPVVSTTIGAQGLGAQDGTHLLIADTPQAIAEALVRLIGDHDLQHRLRVNGRALYESAFTFERIADQVAGLVAGVLGTEPSANVR